MKLRKNFIAMLSLSLAVVPLAASCSDQGEFEGFYLSNQNGGGIELHGPLELSPDAPYQLYAVPINEAQTVKVNWTTSNSSIAAISTTGLVSYVGNGSVTITATNRDNTTDFVSIDFRANDIDVEARDEIILSVYDYFFQGIDFDSDFNLIDHNATYGFYSSPTAPTPLSSFKVTADGAQYNYLSAHNYAMNYIRTGYNGNYAFWGNPITTNAQGVPTGWGTGDPRLYTLNGNPVINLFFNVTVELSAEQQLDEHVRLTSIIQHIFAGEMNENDPEASERYLDLYSFTKSGNLRFSFAGLEDNGISLGQQFMINYNALYTFLSLLQAFPAFIDTIAQFEVVLNNAGEVDHIVCWDAPYERVGERLVIPSSFTESELGAPTYLRISDIGTTTLDAKALSVAAAVDTSLKWSALPTHPYFG